MCKIARSAETQKIFDQGIDFVTDNSISFPFLFLLPLPITIPFSFSFSFSPPTPQSSIRLLDYTNRVTETDTVMRLAKLMDYILVMRAFIRFVWPIYQAR